MRPSWLSVLSLLVTACSSAPRVDVSVEVTDPHGVVPGKTPTQILDQASRAVRMAAMKLTPPDQPTHLIAAPQSVADVEALVAELRVAPIDELPVPANTLSRATPDAWPGVRTALLAPRSRSKTEYKRVLALIGGDVPNRYGHFALAWKRAHGHSVKLSGDWFADLLALPEARVSSKMRPVYRDALATSALLRAASRVAQADRALAADVVGSLLEAAYMHGGTFRDEVGRTIVGIGRNAISPLVRASTPPVGAADDAPETLKASYASFNLDRMDRLQPQRAVDAVRDDPEELAELLAAYAGPRPGEAAALILAHADHRSPAVRAAARSTFRAYVHGPLPRVKRRDVRKLGGVVEKRSAGVSYRARASSAIREAVAANLPSELEDECDLRTEDGSLDSRCVAQPQRLTGLLFASFDAKRRHATQARLAAALDHDDAETGALWLDELLAAGAPLAEPTAVADFFAERANAMEEPRDRARALRKSAALIAQADPEQSHARLRDAMRQESQIQGLAASAVAILGPETDGPQLHAPRSADRGRFVPGFLAFVVVLGSLSTLGARRTRQISLVRAG